MPWQPNLLSHRRVKDDLSLGVWLMSLIFTNNEEKHLFSTVDCVAALSWPAKALIEPRNATNFNLKCGYLNSFGEGGFNWQRTSVGSKVSHPLTVRFYSPSHEGLEPCITTWAQTDLGVLLTQQFWLVSSGVVDRRSFSRLFHKRLVLGQVLPICGNISPMCVSSGAQIFPQLNVFLRASLYQSHPSPWRSNLTS